MSKKKQALAASNQIGYLPGSLVAKAKAAAPTAPRAYAGQWFMKSMPQYLETVVGLIATDRDEDSFYTTKRFYVIDIGTADNQWSSKEPHFRFPERDIARLFETEERALGAIAIMSDAYDILHASRSIAISKVYQAAMNAVTDDDFEHARMLVTEMQLYWAQIKDATHHFVTKMSLFVQRDAG